MTARNENDPPKRAVLREFIKFATGEARGFSRLTDSTRLAATSAEGAGLEPEAAMNRSARLSNGCHTSWLHPPHTHYARRPGR
jgi:hypothetical protein